MPLDHRWFRTPANFNLDEGYGWFCHDPYIFLCLFLSESTDAMANTTTSLARTRQLYIRAALTGSDICLDLYGLYHVETKAV